MCRWLAYQGEPTLLEDYVTRPAHSLTAQSLRSDQAKVATNGDGFGIGWYGERAEPGLYREVRPAWSDENLKSICAQVRSPLFFAHVRASTGTSTSRVNCHPFSHGRMMFMHNGQIGGYCAIRRKVEALIPDALYPFRYGATDSEAIFLIALGRGLESDPLGAMASTMRAICRLMAEAAIAEPLRLTVAVSNGRDLFAFRWASDAFAPSLYFREDSRALLVVSEPLDGDPDCWREVPKGCALIAEAGAPARRRCLNEAIRAAA